ncbi:transposase [Rapidithrix thailandica]|uniref:Transposase n=1 Tax=Rapidithrix thailandica TaxID=413964 RepID=A0AAW9S8R3_9BACT
MIAPKSMILSLLFSFALLACGGGDESSKSSESAQEENEVGLGDYASALKEMEKAAEEMEKNMEEGVTVEPVDFRKLKELLPQTAVGIERTSTEGEKTGTMGFKMSNVEAGYETEDYSKSVEVTIMDMGSMGAGMSVLAAGWIMADIDRETENEYEKTTKIQGHKAFEKFDYNDKRGELSLLVAKRFIVEIKGKGVEMDELKEVVDEIDLDALEAMKDEGKSKE